MECVTYYTNRNVKVQYAPEEIDGFMVDNDNLILKREGFVIHIIAKGYWRRVGIESNGAVV